MPLGSSGSRKPLRFMAVNTVKEPVSSYGILYSGVV